ncbi:accessory factor UbiK family protein [Hyphomonas sp. NPDC076900]|jgi:BMFP domain-containing protein YqiC|uniref:accessory factor UbiK family protein n=1 Tax=unclassified Hyphomonas TaxID=2630699 RepID=UPI000BCDA6E6|nr:accessory factor UbiK family protein [Hyphomonas sp. 34-62-18]OZB17064.1 MAG: pyrroline-5-carboxylate reductase [Hyphomonas sp. 34-62-18]
MASTNPLLDDIAGLMTGALGAARAAGEEAKTAAQARVRALIADMDLAGRDEVEALKAIATAALERVEALEARIAALEAGKSTES